MFAGTDWVDPEDPTVIAENELLRAASSIEAAALKLSQLKPRPKAEVITEFLIMKASGVLSFTTLKNSILKTRFGINDKFR